MPTSTKEGKKLIISWVKDLTCNVNRILDLGVGDGTYHKLFHKKNTNISSAYWIGIEAWKKYIIDYNLESIYDEIINDDIRFIDYDLFSPIDIAFAGDVLEHISKEEAIDVVNRVLAVSDYMIISIPIIKYPQEDLNGNHFEIHIKDDWSHREMMETFPQIKKSWTGSTVGCYLLSTKKEEV